MIPNGSMAEILTGLIRLIVCILCYVPAIQKSGMVMIFSFYVLMFWVKEKKSETCFLVL